MSTNFTGDRTSGLAPSPTPDPESIPISTLPADGDPANAASIAQALKTPLNEIAWLKIRQAKASAWTQPIARHKNARGWDRFYVDHMGNPMFQGIVWDENWDWLGGGFDWTNLTESPWNAVPGTGSVRTRGPTLSAPAHPLFQSLKIAPPTGAATPSFAYRNGVFVPTDDLGAVMKWSAAIDAVGANRTTITMGLVDLTAAGTLPSSPNWGCWFSKTNGDVNWQCNVTGLSPIDTGVAPIANAFNDFKIELHGANESDTAAGIVKFYIGSVEKASFAVTLSSFATNADPMCPVLSALTTTTGGAAVALYVGPVKGRHNTFLNLL